MDLTQGVPGADSAREYFGSDLVQIISTDTPSSDDPFFPVALNWGQRCRLQEGARCLRKVERAVQSRRGTAEGGRCRRRPRRGVGPLRAPSLTLIDRRLCFKHRTRGSQGALGLPPPKVSPPWGTGVWETSEAVSLGAYHMDLLDLVGARAHGF